MIQTTKIKLLVHSKGLSLGSGFNDKLEEDLMVVVERACERAINNGRKTVFPKDL